MNTTTLPPSIRPELSIVPTAAPKASLLVPVPRARLANANAARDAELLARRGEIEALYTAERASLTHAARRLVESGAEASDIVQEAFTVLLESPNRKATRGAAWCVVRDLARDRRAEEAKTDPYVEDEEDLRSEAAAWLEQVLGG